MSKRTVSIVVVLAIVTIGAALYLRQRTPRVPIHSVGVPLTLVHGRAENSRKAIIAARGARRAKAAPSKEFSERKYRLLRRRYKPHEQQAYGALNAYGLKLLGHAARTAVKADGYSQTLGPIVEDVVYGKTFALEQKLEGGLNPNTTFSWGFPLNTNVSLLDVAIQAGQRSVIKLLVSGGASVNPQQATNGSGTRGRFEAPLPLAAFYGEDDVVRELLEQGANSNQRLGVRNDNPSALMQAIGGQNPSTVYLLLTHGADINSVLRPGKLVPNIVIDYNPAPRLVAIRKLLVEYGAKMPPGHR